MKQQRVATALAASLVISGACTILLAHTINHRSAPRTIPDLMYAAPSRTLQAGEIVKPDCVELVAWPGNKPLHGAFSQTDVVVGRAVLFPLEKGEPFLDRDVSAVGAGAGLAGKIPDGMRAIALRSDEIVGVAGFLTPGSHVDVLGTFRLAASADQITATVLENAEVLAVGQRVEPDPEGKPLPAVTVVTLLLTPEEAERAVLASSQGSVRFVLRNGADLDQHKTTPMMMSMLSGLQPIGKPDSGTLAPAPMPVHVQAAKAPSEIETVLGGGATSKPEGGTQQ